MKSTEVPSSSSQRAQTRYFSISASTSWTGITKECKGYDPLSYGRVNHQRVSGVERAQMEKRGTHNPSSIPACPLDDCTDTGPNSLIYTKVSRMM
jgi:hypothetical protein